MKHSNIMGHCGVKAVTHKHDPLANASLGRTGFCFFPPPRAHPPLPHPGCGRARPSLITAAHVAVASTSNRLTFCTLNDLIGIGHPDQNAKITSYLDLLIDHFEEEMAGS